METLNEIDINVLIAKMPGYVYWVNRNNVYQGCNELQASTFGLSSNKDIIGLVSNDILTLSSDIAEIYNKNNFQAMQKKQDMNFEEPGVLKNGNRCILFSQKKVLLNTNGDLIGVINLSIDISEQRQREDELKRKMEENDLSLEHIMALLPGNVYWKNKEGVYLGCNTLQAQIVGLHHSNEVIGKTDFDFPMLEKESADEFRRNDLRVMNQKIVETVEETAYINDKKVIYLSKKSALIDRKNNVIGVLGVSFDITEKKEIEELLVKEKEKAETANNAKTEFLENMRHDIRTPLSGIIGFSEILRREEDKNKIKEHALILAESSKELLRFLNEVLESINVASGKIPLLKKKFDLRETLENIIKLHQPKALEKNLNLTLYLDESIPKYLLGDPVRIYRIILELLVNALKFTQEGHITISTKIRKKEARDVVLQIFIEDTGLGIPLEKQQDLFVRFKRLTPSYQGIYQGSGLGLSIVKQFIDDLQGEIYVDSHLNVGTKFVCIIPLTLPLLDEPFEGGKISTALENSTIFKLNSDKHPKRNIKKYGLIVEDQPIAALAVKMLLEQQGCIMEIAETGEMAVKLAKENQYDFIIMDIGLPDIDGYEVTKAIRAFATSQPQPFIAGLTGHIAIENKQCALDAGMNVFLTKPLTEEMAVNLLKNI